MSSFARLAVVAVWLYQGGWCKLVRPSPRHLAIVEGLPFVGPRRSQRLLALIGCGEVGLALWVLSGRAPKLAAAAQTVALAAMNGGGLLFSAREVDDPGAMLAQNVAFLGLVWSLARR